MITDRESGEPSYVRLEAEDKEWTVGPFAYTKEADARTAAKNHSFLPDSLEDVELDVAEIEGMGLVKGILTRFDPSETDVFALDEGLLPLTPAGAQWVDKTTGKPFWRPLFLDDLQFDESGPARWLNAILEQVSQLLGVEMIKLSLDKQDIIQAKANAARAKIAEHIKVHVEPDVAVMFGTIDPDTTFRVVTRGMSKLDRPDLEMTGVQPLFIGDAMALVAGWAAYSLDHPVVPGISLLGSVEPVTVILKVEAGGSPHTYRLAVEQVLYTNPLHSTSGTVH
tara:strand:+ start:3137 stop:3979 length:843 start_codon:yes stop_codon:yes gene_type:complete